MKSVHTKEYEILLEWLVDRRKEAGLTQQELSRKLGKPQSYVSKYEKGERRLDIIEFLRITKTINAKTHGIIEKLEAIIKGRKSYSE